MARHARAPLLLALVATLAVVAASASAYARAADAGTELLIGDDDDVLGLGGMFGGRRRLDDANATGLDDGNATSIDDGNATSIDAAVTWAGFISYAALSRDSVPCSLRGASYYNCRPGAEATPYSRGCSTITQCRG
ncbi:protein RALF-like 22 [Miscanthus floridulus]|uniref:protein RALF-like 22 n=1 Tax=Miscanthus floridulus TaxID=154761 RepID=UPI00345B08F2